MLAVLGVGCLAVITNLVVLRHDYERMSDWATRARGALAAFEVGGSSADPNFVTGPDNTDIVSLDSLQVGAYLSAVDAFGSPAYGASALAGASEEARVAADQLLADAEDAATGADCPPAPARRSAATFRPRSRWGRRSPGKLPHGHRARRRITTGRPAPPGGDGQDAGGRRGDRRAATVRVLLPAPLSAPGCWSAADPERSLASALAASGLGTRTHPYLRYRPSGLVGQISSAACCSAAASSR